MALEIAYPKGSRIADEDFASALGMLPSDQAVAEQLGAARLLEEGKLTDQQRTQLVTILDRLSPLTLQRVLTTFFETGNKTVQTQLVQALGKLDILEVLPESSL